MHGKVRLPGSKLYCTLPDMQPDEPICHMCGGRQQVIRCVRYEPLTTTASQAQSGYDDAEGGVNQNPSVPSPQGEDRG